MARARNIKPAFFQNEELGELDPLARLFFIGLWTQADYKGCIEFRPKRLKIQILPYDNCDIEEIANDLEESGLIVIYSVQGQRYIKVWNFEKHQNPHKNERDSGSDIPDIEETSPQTSNDGGSGKIENNPEQDGTAPADSLIPLTDSLKPPAEIGTSPDGKKTPSKFSPPTEQQVFDYFSERGYPDRNEAAKFFNFYESKGWLVGKAKMKDWQAAIRGWIGRNTPSLVKTSAPSKPRPLMDICAEQEASNG